MNGDPEFSEFILMDLQEKDFSLISFLTTVFLLEEFPSHAFLDSLNSEHNSVHAACDSQ